MCVDYDVLRFGASDRKYKVKGLGERRSGAGGSDGKAAESSSNAASSSSSGSGGSGAGTKRPREESSSSSGGSSSRSKDGERAEKKAKVRVLLSVMHAVAKRRPAVRFTLYAVPRAYPAQPPPIRPTPVCQLPPAVPGSFTVLIAALVSQTAEGTVRVRHILVKHRGSRRPSSWKVCLLFVPWVLVALAVPVALSFALRHSLA